MQHKKNKDVIKDSNCKKPNCKPQQFSKPNRLILTGIVFFSCSLFVFVTIFLKNKNTKFTQYNSTAITAQADFDTIKNNILQNKKLNNISKNKNTSDTHISNNVAYVNNKYIAIIKKNKIFLVTAKNGSFITSLNISPISNNNEIYYYNIFTINNNIIVTGYRKDTQVLEITKLHLSKNLTFKRDAIYRIPSLSQNHDALSINNNLIFYTTHEITAETTNSQLSSIEIWSEKENDFILHTLQHQTILYDKILSPTNPIIHTITSCPFKDLAIDPQKCTQKQIIDSHNAIFNKRDENILLTINNTPSTHSFVPTHFYTKKYYISPTDKGAYISTSQQDEQSPIIFSKKTLLSQHLSTDKDIVIYKDDNKILAKIIYPQKNMDTPFHFFTLNPLMSKYATKVSTLIQDTNLQTDKSNINIFNFNGITFISIAFTDISGGQLNLFKIDDENTIHSIYSLPIASPNTGIPNQFFANTTTNKLYALTNNYFRQFKYSTNNIIPTKTTNYTHKPVYKPKLKMTDYPVGAKKVNGKYVCKKKKDEYVGKSKKNNKGYYHLDKECCLDPDEYPNPWCTYRPGELSRTNLRYKDYTGKKIKR